MDELNIYVPFVFSESIDPRAIRTVGDQLICEHIFAFHSPAKRDLYGAPVFSEVSIDEVKNKVRIHLLRKVLDSNGTEISSDKIYESLKSSLIGSRHTQYGSFIKAIKCVPGLIELEMTSIPWNFKNWICSLDFAISNLENLPITHRSKSFTGPYKLVSLSPRRAELEINNFFPNEHRSNSIPRVNLISSSIEETEIALENGNASLAYCYGYSVKPQLLEKAKRDGYLIQIYPEEWFIYLGFNRSLDFNSRDTIALYVDQIKKNLLSSGTFGSTAYSLSPNSKKFGLTEDESMMLPKKLGAMSVSRKIKLATLDEWAVLPLFDLVINELRERFQVEVRFFSRNDMAKIYDENESDMYLSPLGITASDPLANFTFYSSQNELFKEVIPESVLIEINRMNNHLEFCKQIKDVEFRLLENRVFVPIAHFPGLVLESPRLKAETDKNRNWGIQAWKYSISPS